MVLKIYGHYFKTGVLTITTSILFFSLRCLRAYTKDERLIQLNFPAYIFIFQALVG